MKNNTINVATKHFVVIAVERHANGHKHIRIHMHTPNEIHNHIFLYDLVVFFLSLFLYIYIYIYVSLAVLCFMFVFVFVCDVVLGFMLLFLPKRSSVRQLTKNEKALTAA